MCLLFFVSAEPLLRSMNWVAMVRFGTAQVSAPARHIPASGRRPAVRAVGGGDPSGVRG